MKRAPRGAAAALSIPVRPNPDAARCLPAPAESAHAAAVALAERRARESVRSTPSAASLPIGRSNPSPSASSSSATTTPRHKLSNATAPSPLGPIAEHPALSATSSGFSALLDLTRQRSANASDTEKPNSSSAASRLISRLQSFTDSDDSQTGSESRGYFSKLDSIANWFKSSDSSSKVQTGGSEAAASSSEGPAPSLFGGRLTALREQYRVAHVDFERERGELRLLRTYLDHLRREYAEAKQLDVVRRYNKLKVMIKRAIMYLRLSNNELVDLQGIGSPTSTQSPNGGWAPKRSAASGAADLNRQKKIAAPAQDSIGKKSAEELEIEMAATKASTADVSRRVRAIKQCIEELEQQYEGSKRVSPLLRYSLLKQMVKSVFENPAVKE